MALIITVLIFFIVPTLKWQLVAVTMNSAVARLLARQREQEQAQLLGFTPKSDEQHFMIFLGVTAGFAIIILMLHGGRFMFRKFKNAHTKSSGA